MAFSFQRRSNFAFAAPMKIITAALILFAASVPANAQDPAIQQLIQKRGDILSRIHELTQERYTAGSTPKEDVMVAALNLFIFRRDHSKEVSGRVQWQERILALQRERLAFFEEKQKAGDVIATDVLRVAEQTLEAEQKLLELKAGI